ncbi:MAG TPA: NapC/NirT family cytochrome c [Alphaproteobacteria bacterium]|nr:NapC/NirT family cytochrome c [Alphaproteobacteria bacterium]
MSPHDTATSGSVITSSMQWLRAHWALVGALCGSVFLGMVLTSAWVTIIEHTNHTSFCIGCHVMADTVYPEYQQSKHFKNQHGVVVGCPDCHVPQYSWVDELVVKVATVKELYAFFLRGVNTAEKFTPERPKLAREAWAHFYATNARECRHCHDYNNMVFAQQSQAAQLIHPEAMKTNANCLDCHKGVVHNIPPGASD